MNSGNQTTLSGSGYVATGYHQLLPHIQFQTLEVLLATSIFITIHSLRQSKRHGLATWPVVGMLPSLLLGLRHNMYEWLTGVLYTQGGTFTFHGPWLTNLHCLVTADPRNLEHLLKTKFSNFPKGPYFHSTVEDLLGDGIFSIDGDAWRRQRRTASIEFHSTAFRSLTSTSLVDLVQSHLLPILDSAAAVGGAMAIDLQEVLLRLTFDNVCIMAFGTDPGCLRQGLPEIPFAKAFEDATEATTLRFVTPTAVWKMLRFIGVGNERRLKTSLKTVDEFAYSVIAKRKEELAAEVAPARTDLLTVFMKQREEEGFTDKFLRDICVNFILAGRDTSSVALAWFFWLLGMNPAVEERIVEELRGIVAERGRSSGEDVVVFRPEEVKKMEYLHAALSEALRLYPSVPVDHKEVIEDEVFPDGNILKKGTKIIYSMYTMGRMESIWGSNCREYRPERWMKDGHFMSESAYKFTAFNGGPRLCLGKDFAYYQMKFVASSIIYRYRVKVVKSHPVVPKLALTMYMKYGLKVMLSRRDESKEELK